MGKTTSTGTMFTVEDRGGNRAVIADNPGAPADLRHMEVGRIILAPPGLLGFQMAPDADYGLTAEGLRFIADLIEQEPTA